jgi:methylmalonyl-CoA mutase C-terminal domain/subunit
MNIHRLNIQHCPLLTGHSRTTCANQSLDGRRKILRLYGTETISYFYANQPPFTMSDTQVNRPIRVLIAKVGLDGHDRGARIIATTLRDAGMEVIYTGLRQTPEMVVNTALQEDVDAIGISILSGAHMTVFPKVMALIKQKGMDDVLLTGGGIIPADDMAELKKIGVGELFPPGTSTADIVKYITEWVHANRNF